MNAYKLNGIAGSTLRIAICDYLQISYSEVYRKVKNINPSDSTITLDTGEVYKLTLTSMKENDSK